MLRWMRTIGRRSQHITDDELHRYQGQFSDNHVSVKIMLVYATLELLSSSYMSVLFHAGCTTTHLRMVEHLLSLTPSRTPPYRGLAQACQNETVLNSLVQIFKSNVFTHI